ncbi:3-carboxy-cis,cis-muconate cycloisomerase [Martelella alba]|uniref:3-carboxy-cis,cis-muconate cycloisomerase n=1 Tax=Martelella alba TaxID=2590451 RepID=A0A506UDF5_9HYPH|nr:3-carboxy-cis,cis-muconate cycloisomerase [Martelella alba]TPW31161.1 3-carboxy-cis,cis-muconate cycloisomerase [Martelella alba]
MSYSAFDHPVLSGLVGDDEVAACFSFDAEVKAMLAFEAALAEAEARVGAIPQDAADRIAAVCAGFAPDIGSLRQATSRDGIVVPDLVRQLRLAVGGDAAAYVHFGATSQDVIDTSLMMRLSTVSSLFLDRLDHLFQRIDTLDARFGANQLMARTRMQPALPITVSDRLRSWREPVLYLRQFLLRLDGQLFAVQFGGAAGTLDKLPEQGVEVRATLADLLGLIDAPQWQNQRNVLAEFASCMSQISGNLGKFGLDIALLAEMGDEIELIEGGESSDIEGKRNPVAAEVLVSLARFNAANLSAMHTALVHEQERSGAAWTLEWLTLPQMVAAAAGSLMLADKLCTRIKHLGKA